MAPGRLTVLLACAACGAAICFNRVLLISNGIPQPALNIAGHAAGLVMGLTAGLAVGAALVGLHALAVRLFDSAAR
ncbi:MAG TPA: hypothetical protein VKT77_17535 [Chthonomonadaceae bacterium]|nr:hypothetical protein [Chthonomonadaceae bacterium]